MKTITKMSINQVSASIFGFVVFVLVLLLLASTFCGCSPTQQTVLDRAHQGLNNEQEFVAQWHDLAVKGIVSQRARLLDASYETLRMAIAGELKLPDGTPVKPDAEWLAGHRANLEAGNAELDRRKAELDDMLARNQQNVHMTDAAIAGAQDLNRAWAGQQDALQAQLARIETLIAAQQASKTGATK